MKPARTVLALTACLLALSSWDNVTAQGGKSVQPLQMTIDAGNVLPDEYGKVYTDYRAVAGGESCVEVSLDLIFVRFNRHWPDSSTRNFQYCEFVPGMAKRQYSLQIENVTACDELLAASAGHTTPFAVPIDPDGGVVGCLVSGHDKPRIRAGDTFKVKSGGRIAVDFLILSYDSRVAYEVRTDALVTAVNASQRTLTNDGIVTAATLIKNTGEVGSGGSKAPPPVATFPLPFQLTFTKVPAVQ